MIDQEPTDVGQHRLELLAAILQRIEVDPHDLQAPAAVGVVRPPRAMGSRGAGEAPDAQKTTRTTFPLDSARSNGLPSMSVPRIGGAGLPTS